MRNPRSVAVVSAAAFLIATAASAQAPPPAPQGAPKPVRLADGHPNWTGFWTPIGGLMDKNFGPGAEAGAPAAAGAGAQTPAPPHADLKAPFKTAYAAGLAQQAKGEVTYDPTALCLPPGMPRMMNATYGLELLQTPGQITITSEWQAESRRIWMDGRKHPDPDEALPTYGGHSTGHWDKDVLVVETVQLRDDFPLDQSGLPHSDAMRLTERISSPQPGFLLDEITVDDPKVYVAPWTYAKRYRYRPELNLQEFVCTENNRNVGPNGEPKFN